MGKFPYLFHCSPNPEYESNGKTQKKWTRLGAAFPHKEGPGYSIELKAFPVDGRLVVLHRSK